jgi:DNA-binding XRE family transcriptional regulator
MKTFKKHLKEKLKNSHFKEIYEEEKEILELSLKIVEARENLGISQKDLAVKAEITQQQLSKIENGINCNIKTFIKVCHALGVKLGLKTIDYKVAM